MSDSDTGDDRHQMKHSDDTFGAIVVLIVILCSTAIAGAYLYKNKAKLLGIRDRPAGASAGFKPPQDREKFDTAKSKLNPNKPEDFEELKKILMHRAMNTIPFILSLQNDGQAIESLYKKGILTDEMHDKVNDVKAFCDAEYGSVMNEAEELKEGWGQEIWPQAMHFHQMRMKEMEKKSAQDKAASNAMAAAGGGGFGSGSLSPQPRSASNSPKPGTPNFMPSGMSKTPDTLEMRKAKAAAMEKQLLAEEERDRISKNSATKKK